MHIRPWTSLDPKNPHAIIGFNVDLLAALIRQMGLKGGTIVPSDFHQAPSLPQRWEVRRCHVHPEPHPGACKTRRFRRLHVGQ